MLSPALISAGASLLSGVMGKKAADSAQQSQERQNEANIALQREFAQSGIQWKVADAKAAGIHPLAALGAQTHSFAPVVVGAAPDYSMANAVGQMGQNLSSAVARTRDAGQRFEAAFSAKSMQLDLEHKELQNYLLASQIKRLQAEPSPGIPDVSRGAATGSSVVRPAEVTAGRFDDPAITAGPAGSAFSEYKIGGPNVYGTISVPSNDASQGMESQGTLATLYQSGMHALLRSIDEFYYGGNKPKIKYEIPAGRSWEWDRIKQKWRLK